MGYRFRTPGPWGPGESEDLPPEAVDGNFWQAIQDIAAKAAQGVGIANIVASGNEWTVVLTDHTLVGPFVIQMPAIVFQGEWQPDHNYLAGDIITNGGSTYMVRANHLSAATFDPGANNGLGQDYYGLLLQNPAITIPMGGALGAFLRKLSGADLDTYWGSAALTDLSDVSLVSPPPAVGDLFTFDGSVWVASSRASLEMLLTQLGDVQILETPAPQPGQLLTFDGTFWTNIPPAFNPAVHAPAPGQILTFENNEWINSGQANIPVLPTFNVFGPLALDYKDGAVQRVVMTNGVTMDWPIANWPPAGQFARLVLEVRNTGAFTFTWPVEIKWPGGAIPEVSVSGRDMFALTTFDGGLSVDGSIIGQNYM